MSARRLKAFFLLLVAIGSAVLFGCGGGVAVAPSYNTPHIVFSADGSYVRVRPTPGWVVLDVRTQGDDRSGKQLGDRWYFEPPLLRDRVTVFEARGEQTKAHRSGWFERKTLAAWLGMSVLAALSLTCLVLLAVFRWRQWRDEEQEDCKQHQRDLLVHVDTLIARLRPDDKFQGYYRNVDYERHLRTYIRDLGSYDKGLALSKLNEVALKSPRLIAHWQEDGRVDWLRSTLKTLANKERIPAELPAHLRPALLEEFVDGRG